MLYRLVCQAEGTEYARRKDTSPLTLRLKIEIRKGSAATTTEGPPGGGVGEPRMEKQDVHLDPSL
jgi:hypothetical protein